MSLHARYALFPSSPPMLLVNFTSVAIFVLATTRPTQRISAYESRIEPIAHTWGSLFPHLFFVFGTNVFDLKFVRYKCQLASTVGLTTPSPVDERKLLASAPQTPPENKTELYMCPTSLVGRAIQVLRIANCTGEYFGIGPTCRAQESMRYYLARSGLGDRFYSVDWFLFLDDDNYIRPYALLGFLDGMLRNRSLSDFVSSSGIALVSSATHRGFGFSKRHGTGINVNWTSTCFRHKFAIAQPSLIHRRALQNMKVFVENNGLTELQAEWGGTHDALVGMMTWLYDIPVFSMAQFYVETQTTVDQLHELPATTKRQGSSVGIFKKDVFIVHRVKNMRTGKKLILRVPSQYDIADYFGDIYNNRSVATDHRRDEMSSSSEQINVGQAGVMQLIRMAPSTVSTTVFADKARDLKYTFALFRLVDCDVIADGSHENGSRRSIIPAITM